MPLNNNTPVSPTRQITKRLTQKMKLKRTKMQKAKLSNQNNTQLKTNNLQE